MQQESKLGIMVGIPFLSRACQQVWRIIWLPSGLHQTGYFKDGLYS